MLDFDGVYGAFCRFERSFENPDISSEEVIGSSRGVAFSPDVKTVASASQDSSVKLWDVSTKQELSTLKGHERTVSALAFSPDGKTLTGAWEGKIILWLAATDEEVAAQRNK